MSITVDPCRVWGSMHAHTVGSRAADSLCGCCSSGERYQWYGVLLCFFLRAQLVSTVLTVALLGGAAWFYFQYGGSSDDSSKRSSGSSSSKDVDLNDPLAEARRIMDKYKK